ncbi:hypothetical protein U91I_02884 [alpha proteobacterium U9-1i]|nr:hypothetical protein U91I_02884 [alpha proteobacterium U9-1i]
MARDDVEKRASEIRARGLAAEQELAALEEAQDEERKQFVRRFSAALLERTPHAVQCLAIDPNEDELGVLVRFHFYIDSKARFNDVAQIGVDRAERKGDDWEFSYYLRPSAGAYGVELDGGVEELAYAQQGEVLTAATALVIEMMANVVASGGRLGTPSEVTAMLAAAEKEKAAQQSAARKERARSQRRGCLVIFLGFVGFCMLMGLLNNATS